MGEPMGRFSAVRTISAAAWSKTWWSNAFKRMRIFWAMAVFPCRCP